MLWNKNQLLEKSPKILSSRVQHILERCASSSKTRIITIVLDVGMKKSKIVEISILAKIYFKTVQVSRDKFWIHYFPVLIEKVVIAKIQACFVYLAQTQVETTTGFFRLIERETGKNRSFSGHLHNLLLFSPLHPGDGGPQGLWRWYLACFPLSRATKSSEEKMPELVAMAKALARKHPELALQIYFDPALNSFTLEHSEVTFSRTREQEAATGIFRNLGSDRGQRAGQIMKLETAAATQVSPFQIRDRIWWALPDASKKRFSLFIGWPAPSCFIFIGCCCCHIL